MKNEKDNYKFKCRFSLAPGFYGTYGNKRLARSS